MNIFTKGSEWEASRVSDALASRRRAYIVAGAASVLVVALVIANISMLPLRRTIPYLVKVDNQTGNVEVLQTFDNRQIGKQELTDQYWARTYVKAREQYNWWMVGSDYETVSRLSAPAAFAEYATQFVGEKALDKVFGEATDRTVKILSVTPNPTQPYQMVVRFERTTKTKGMVVEQPTIFVAQIVYRYQLKTAGAQADLQQNPLGYEVVNYRRDVEVGTATVDPVVEDLISKKTVNGAPQ